MSSSGLPNKRKILTHLIESSGDHEDGWGQDNMAYMKRCQEVGLFSLEKGGLRGHLVAVCNSLLRGYKENRGTLF